MSPADEPRYPRMPIRSDPVRYLSPEQVCELVPVLTPRDLEDMRSNNTGPAYSRPTPRKVVYLEADVRAWVRSRRVSTRDQL